MIINDKEILVLEYNIYKFAITFPAVSQQTKTDLIKDNLYPSTIHRELLSLKKVIDKNNYFFSIKDDELIDKKEITMKMEMLQHIIDSSSPININKFNFVDLVDSVRFFHNLNLFSVITHIYKLMKQFIDNDKMKKSSNETKSSLYICILELMAVIQAALNKRRCDNLKSFKEVAHIIDIYEECKKTFIIILIDMEKPDLENIIKVIYERYLISEDINEENSNFITYITTKNNFYLLRIIIKKIIICIINNKNLQDKEKLEILKTLAVYNDNGKLIKIKNSSENSLLLVDLCHETLNFYNNHIASTNITQLYLSIANVNDNKNNFSSLLKMIKVNLELINDENKNNNNNKNYTDITSLINIMNAHEEEFNFSFNNDDNNEKEKDLEIKNHQLQKDIEALKKELSEKKEKKKNNDLKSIIVNMISEKVESSSRILSYMKKEEEYSDAINKALLIKQDDERIKADYALVIKLFQKNIKELNSQNKQLNNEIANSINKLEYILKADNVNYNKNNKSLSLVISDISDLYKRLEKNPFELQSKLNKIHNKKSLLKHLCKYNNDKYDSLDFYSDINELICKL